MCVTGGATNHSGVVAVCLTALPILITYRPPVPG